MATLITEKDYEIGIAAIKMVDADGNVIYTIRTVIDVITEDGFNIITDTDEDKIILEYVIASNAYNENLDSLYIDTDTDSTLDLSMHLLI